MTLFFSQLLEKYNTHIIHFFGAKPNMSLKVNYNEALQNRQKLADYLNISLKNFVFAQQTHSDNIRIVTPSETGAGAFHYASAIPNTDALITHYPNIMLTITTADCVPILLFDKQNLIIAAIHSGWRGTAKHITEKTINLLKTAFSSNPKNIIAAIGPSIGPCCYEIKHDVEQQIINSFPEHKKILIHSNNKIFLDLWTANKLQLLNQGLPEQNIHLLQICTKCNPHLLFSARNNHISRQINGIMLKKI